MPTFDSDRATTVCGVPGRLTHRTTKPGQAPGLWFKQRWVSEARPITGHGDGAVIQAELRFDDELGNRHNTFAVTGEIYRAIPYNTKRGSGARKEWIAGGCCHDEIAKAFPELAHLIRWHLFDQTGPMHYIANTVYHAGDRDHNGLRKGKRRQLVNGKTKEKCWELVAINSEGVGISDTQTGQGYIGAETVPLFILNTTCTGDAPRLATPKLEWRPRYIVGEGKARDLDAARSTAVWPDATDEVLCQEPAELKATLLRRLDALLVAFRADMDAAGFIWAPEEVPAA